jgi:membrane associated rhomboid family serine protease
MSNFRQVRSDNFPPVVKNLIILNVLVWVAQLVFKDQFLTARIALWPVDSPFFEPYQIFTHMFAHSDAGLIHLLFNMFMLWMFGKTLENVWGSKRFLTFYLLCGIGAAAAHLLIQYLTGGFSFVVGASGAIFGVFAAFALLFPNTEMYIMFIPVPIKAKWVAIGYMALDLFGGISQTPGDNIAHFAHLGGALTGVIIVLIWNKTNKKTLY